MATKPTTLIVIVGPTASGKSSLAMEFAHQFDGEIICADSRTVYKEMDIGTAKPSLRERQEIPHHLLDIVQPDKKFSVADFKQRANQAIKDINTHNKIPIMVGGSGLYIDAVLFDFEFNEVADDKLRDRLQKMSIAELQKEIKDRKLLTPKNSQNPRHLMRIIETNGKISSRKSLRKNTLVIGISVDRNVLRQKIIKRVDDMLNQGLIQEVRELHAKYKGAEALQAPGYKAFANYINGTSTLEEAKDLFIRNDMQLAKRQMTWFKRNKSIQWCSSYQECKQEMYAFIKNQTDENP